VLAGYYGLSVPNTDQHEPNSVPPGETAQSKFDHLPPEITRGDPAITCRAWFMDARGRRWRKDHTGVFSEVIRPRSTDAEGLLHG
jgi:hypothetical protein